MSIKYAPSVLSLRTDKPLMPPPSWVMMDANNQFVSLPQEVTLYSSMSRTKLSIPSLGIESERGVAYLTNQRLIYIPAESTRAFQSFSAPLLNLYDARPSIPIFGPNAWLAKLRPVPGGNIPEDSRLIPITLSFKEGGAVAFHYKFEQICERLRQVLAIAQENNNPEDRQDSDLSGVNVANVHLDQLPSYQDAVQDRLVTAAADAPQPVRLNHQNGTTDRPEADVTDENTPNQPPSYPGPSSPSINPYIQRGQGPDYDYI
ncbi:hypothetical protein PV08_07009 [Exophiala spinifera]|uniref:GRAM domain-containing protein n=1 Tax=Exophiala spinifera TaxID=91928 RepID=A0A0D1ZN10_9EURO|nr:uncharacterized protein PV08_07009 [Exophiala spinifera]KIW14227.1 hypothetical protein PV08_07009 [Exophiala spinifera]